MERIAQAQAEETRQTEIKLPTFRVPDEVVDRALTCGGNGQHSMERIVAFFQKNPRNEDAAAFLAKEYGEGGKGIVDAGEKYAVWFDKKGFRVHLGTSTREPVGVDLPWPAVAVRVSRLLQEGRYASQEKIAAAKDNEYRELAGKLWHLRQDFSDSARERNLLPTVSQHFLGKGFPDDTQEIAGLLKDPDKDRRRTPDTFLMTFSFFLQRFCQGVTNYSTPEHEAIFPALTREQLRQIRAEIQSVHTALDGLFHKMEGCAQK